MIICLESFNIVIFSLVVLCSCYLFIYSLLILLKSYCLPCLLTQLFLSVSVGGQIKFVEFEFKCMVSCYWQCRISSAKSVISRYKVAGSTFFTGSKSFFRHPLVFINVLKMTMKSH